MGARFLRWIKYHPLSMKLIFPCISHTTVDLCVVSAVAPGLYITVVFWNGPLAIWFPAVEE